VRPALHGGTTLMLHIRPTCPSDPSFLGV
jgi:hypothetical protein